MSLLKQNWYNRLTAEWQHPTTGGHGATAEAGRHGANPWNGISIKRAATRHRPSWLWGEWPAVNAHGQRQLPGPEEQRAA